MPLRALRWLVVCLLGCLPSSAQVRITVTATDGSPLRSALVIVQRVQPGGDHELLRALTDNSGATVTPPLDAGLYRAIATYPYGKWETSVREFLVRGDAVNVQLRLAPAVNIDAVSTSIGQLTVHVLDASGRPAEGARVLVRDAQASPRSEHWGTTNAQGTTTLELTLNPAVLVVVYHDQLYFFSANTFDTERTLRLK